MLTKLGCYIKELFCDIKRKLLANKAIFYVALGALAIGVLIALSKDYSDCDGTNNFIFVMLEGETSPIPQLLRIILWLPTVYLLLLLTSLHFGCFAVIGIGGIATGTYLFARNAFIAIAVAPASGVPYLILYVIPTLAVTFVCVVCILQDINLLMDFGRNRKHITSLRCNMGALCRIFKPYFIANLIFLLVYWLIFYLILLLFC